MSYKKNGHLSNALELLAMVLSTAAGFALVLCSCVAWYTRLPAALVLGNLPVLPDATIYADGRRLYVTEFGFETAVDYRTSRPQPEVTAFYREEMSKRGWTLVKDEVTGGNIGRECLIFRRYGFFVVSVYTAGTIHLGIGPGNTITVQETGGTVVKMDAAVAGYAMQMGIEVASPCGF